MKLSQVTSMSWLRATLFFSTIGLLAGQISGPVTGYVFHSPTKSIRPILGIPGGAVLANPIVSNLRFGSVSPDGKWAVVSRVDASAVVKLGLAASVEQRPAGLIAGIDLAAWGTSNQVAVVGSSSGKQIQTIRYSGGRWLVDTPRDLSHLAGSLTALSTDSTGGQVAFGMTDAAQSALYLESKTVPTLLISASVPVVAAFAPGGQVLYAAGSAPGVIEVFEGTKRARILMLAPEGGTLPEVTALAPSADGKRLLAIAKDLRKVWSFDLVSGHPVVRSLEAAPATLQPVAGSSWLLQTSADKKIEPIIFVKDSDTLTTSFVPVAEADRSSL